MGKDAGKVAAPNGEGYPVILADAACRSGNDDIEPTPMDMENPNAASRLPPKKRRDFRGDIPDLNEPFHGPPDEEEKLLTNTERVGLEHKDLCRGESPDGWGTKKRRSRKANLGGTAMSKTRAEPSKLLLTENNGNEEKHGKLTKTAKPKCSKRGFFEINSNEEKHGGSSKAEKPICFKQNGRARKAAKKAENNGARGSTPSLPIPTEITQKIASLSGDNPKLVIEKKLTNTDLHPDSGRLNMPKGRINEKSLLSKEEQENFKERKKDGKRCEEMILPLIEPNLNESSISLRKWKIGSSPSYILCNTGNEVAERNRLKGGKTIQVWSFRLPDGKVGLALVKLKN